MQSAISKSLKKHLDENYSLLISLRLTDETCIFYFEINFLKVSCLHGLNWGSDGDLPLEVSLPCGLYRSASGSALPWTHDTPVSQGPPRGICTAKQGRQLPLPHDCRDGGLPPGALLPAAFTGNASQNVCAHITHTHTCTRTVMCSRRRPWRTNRCPAAARGPAQVEPVARGLDGAQVRLPAPPPAAAHACS